MTDEPWTIGRLLQWTTGFLKERGADSPRLDAEVLLSHALGCPRIALYTAFDQPATDDLRAAFRELVKQRAAGKPVAYLVGQREFYSLAFRVTADVLIPRPETEFLLIRLLDLAKQRSAEASPARIVDVGTGSGILAICAAKELPAAEITAVDISSAALDVARDNARRHGVFDRITFVESDLLAALPVNATFDFIVSNPPYIRTSEMAELRPEVRDHEPRQALEAGPSGTEVIARLVAAAKCRLAIDGWLLVEVSPMIEPAVVFLLRADDTWALQPTVKDLAGLPRVVQARRTA